jgi:hypothetical protein
VFQAVVLSIVLTLAVGPNAAVLCNVWCHLHEAAATGCHHQDAATSPRVTGDDHCNDVAAIVPTFVREDVRPSLSAPDVQHALVGPRLDFIPSSSATRSDHEPGRDWSLEKRPLSTALRI